jgi:hypothetical protein
MSDTVGLFAEVCCLGSESLFAVCTWKGFEMEGCDVSGRQVSVLERDKVKCGEVPEQLILVRRQEYFVTH